VVHSDFLQSHLNGMAKGQKQWDILMVSADPTTNHKLKLQAEERAIRQSLSRAPHEVDITLDVLPAATIDDVAEKLLWKTSNGSFYDIIHFSGHCDQQHSMVRLICSELDKQHGTEVGTRFRSSKDRMKCVHELAMQVSQHLETQAGMYMDELKKKPQSGENEEKIETAGNVDVSVGQAQGKKCEGRGRSKSVDNSMDYLPSQEQGPRSAPPSPRKGEASKNNEDMVSISRNVDVLVEQRVQEDRDMLVFSHGSPPEKQVHQPDEIISNEHDSLVLRLPDYTETPNKTKDIVLTKSQILDAGVGSLAFETHETHGNPYGINFVGAKAFASLIAPYALDLQCVLLNACHSLLVCEQILAAGIPLAICSQGRISDRNALHFSRGFYEALAIGAALERAFLEGENRMNVHKSPKMYASHTVARPHTHHEEEGKVCLMRANGMLQLSKTSARQHHTLGAENKKLKSVIQEGFRLLNEKDKEIEELRKQLEKIKAETVPKPSMSKKKKVPKANKNGRGVDWIRFNRLHVGLKAPRPRVKDPDSSPAVAAPPTSQQKDTHTTNSNSTGEEPPLPPWIPVGPGGELHRTSGNKENRGATTHIFQPRSVAPKKKVVGPSGLHTASMSSGMTTNPMNLSQAFQTEQQQQKLTGFGSSVPRFPQVNFPNPARYENTQN